MISPTRLQTALLAGIGLIVLYFSVQLSSQLFVYLSLRERTPVRIERWEVEEVKGNFALAAHYSFVADNKTFSGACRLRPPYYWNEAAAIAALKNRAKEGWTAWYDPSNPSRSSLEKGFPSGLLIRTLICYGVLIYFLLFKRKLVKIISVLDKK
jgi:hypothetical protein